MGSTEYATDIAMETSSKSVGMTDVPYDDQHYNHQQQQQQKGEQLGSSIFVQDDAPIYDMPVSAINRPLMSELNPTKVAQFAQEMRAGAQFTPIEVAHVQGMDKEEAGELVPGSFVTATSSSDSSTAAANSSIAYTLPQPAAAAAAKHLNC